MGVANKFWRFSQTSHLAKSPYLLPSIDISPYIYFYAFTILRNSEYTGVAVLLTVRIRLHRIGFLPFFLCWGTVQQKSHIQLLTGALKHIYIYLKVHISVFAPNGTHPSICTPTFRHADSLDVLSPPRQQSTRDTRVCLPSLNIQLPTTRRLEKLLHNPCTKPISSCLTLFCVFKPTMYAAFGTTKAIQALSQNGNWRGQRTG